MWRRLLRAAKKRLDVAPYGLLYASDVFFRFGTQALLGAVLVALPMGGFLNFMAGQQAAAVGHRVAVIPTTFEEHWIEDHEHTSLFLFTGLRAMLLCFVGFVMWATPIAIVQRRLRHLLVFILPGMLAFFAYKMARFQMYASGTMQDTFWNECLWTYPQGALYMMIALGALLVACKQQDRRATWICWIAILAIQTMSFVLVRRALLWTLHAQSPFARFGAVWALSWWRSLSIVVGLAAARRVPDLPHDVVVFLTFAAVIVPQTGVSIMQLSNRNSAWAFITFANLIVAEVFKNGCLMSGRTELEELACRLKALARLCCCWRQPARVEPEPMPVLPTAPPEVGVGAAADEAFPELQPEDVDAEAPAKAEPGFGDAVPELPSPSTSPQSTPETITEQHKVLMDVVRASNGLELVSTFFVTAMLLVVDMNPNETDGEPLHWSVVLRNFGYSLSTEIFTDTAAYVFATKHELRQRLLFGDDRTDPRISSVTLRVFTGVVLVVATLESFLHMVSYMCIYPWPDGSLKSISLCS